MRFVPTAGQAGFEPALLDRQWLSLYIRLLDVRGLFGRGCQMTASLFDEIGYWSEIKLDIIREYAQAYSTILSA